MTQKSMKNPTWRPRRRRTFASPEWSERVFLAINPHDVHMFRYLLEAYDNLGYMSVVDRWRAILRVSYSPHQRQEVLDVLEDMRETVAFSFLASPEATDALCGDGLYENGHTASRLNPNNKSENISHGDGANMGNPNEAVSSADITQGHNEN